jgi:hypothetical protein
MLVKRSSFGLARWSQARVIGRLYYYGPKFVGLTNSIQ